jgi:hypothetical protein
MGATAIRSPRHEEGSLLESPKRSPAIARGIAAEGTPRLTGSLGRCLGPVTKPLDSRSMARTRIEGRTGAPSTSEARSWMTERDAVAHLAIVLREAADAHRAQRAAHVARSAVAEAMD